MTGIAPRLEDIGAEGVTIVALVGDEYAHRRSEVQKGGRDGDVGILLPGVRWNAQGLQSGSLKAWIFVVRPPRERPIACLCSPLFRHWPSDVP